MTFERIVVGVDGSTNAHRALLCAIQLAEALGAELVAVHSVGLLERFAEGQSHDHSHHQQQQQFESQWCAPLDDSAVRSRRVARDGNPVSVLLQVASEVDAGLIVVGSRGLGGHPELVLGSTSSEVAQRSTRPVVIVPLGH